MPDFRLKVFHTVAVRLNFTKAAKELYITQPAVTRHIRELEKQFNTKLFDRNGSKIALTPAGNVLLLHTEKIFAQYREMEFELAALSNRHSGRLRIGASTTIAQYILPLGLAQFHKRFGDVKAELTINNTEQIEKALEAEAIDLGVVEGHSRNTVFKYIPFVKDELVLVVRAGHVLAKKGEVSISRLKTIPLLLREPGSGTLEVLLLALEQVGLRPDTMQIEMQLAGTEAMKQYLLNSDAAAFLPVHSVTQELKNNLLCVIEVKGLVIDRQLYFIQKHGQENGLADLFMDCAMHNNFRL